MKSTYYLLLGVVALGAVSCTDSFFEQYPSNSVTENNYYITDDDFDQGVAACYHKLKTQMGYHLNELAYRSDECCQQAMTVSDASTYYFDHFEENSSNAIMSDIWNAWYNGIYRCNDVLDHLEGREELPNYDKYRGEVLSCGRGGISTFTGLSAACPLRTRLYPRPMPRRSAAVRTTRCTPC